MSTITAMSTTVINMFPYVNVISKEMFDLITDNGKYPEVLEFDYEIVHKDDLLETLFGHAEMMRAHLIEVFDTGDLVLDDIIIAEPDVEEIPGYKDVTYKLNESFEILNIPYSYPLKIFIPEDIDIYPKRYEYAYIGIPLIFGIAVSLYQAATLYLAKSDYDEVVLLKMQISDEYGED